MNKKEINRKEMNEAMLEQVIGGRISPLVVRLYKGKDKDKEETK